MKFFPYTGEVKLEDGRIVPVIECYDENGMPCLPHKARRAIAEHPDGGYVGVEMTTTPTLH